MNKSELNHSVTYRITVNDVCGLLLNKSRALEMRLKGKLSRVHFAAVSQAKKKTLLKRN